MEGGRRAQSPSGKGLKGGGIPPIPLFGRGRTGWMGRHVTQGIRGWTGAGPTLSVVGLCSKMADLPVLPEEVYLMIAREYRRATKEMRDDQRWWTVRQELNYLPCCPKKKHLIPRGARVPEGYFWRMIVKSMYRATDRRMLEWFSRFFRLNDCLRPNKAAEWVIIHRKYCNDVHICHMKKQGRKREYQKEQRAYQKKMRQVTQLKA